MDRTLRYTAVMRGEQCHEFSQGIICYSFDYVMTFFN